MESPAAIDAAVGTRDLEQQERITQTASPPPTKSPSPPVSTCRRLSYESAQTRSNTRTSSRSCSAPQPPSQQQLSSRTLPATLLSTQRAHAHLANTNRGMMPCATLLKAPALSASPGNPTASAAAPTSVRQAELRRSSASTPEFVRYNSAPTSPSPVATAATAAVAVPKTTFDKAAEINTNSFSHQRRDNSTFSCVLTNQTRTSSTTELESSNVIRSEEKSGFLSVSPASPPSDQKVPGVVDVKGVEMHSQRQQQQIKKEASVTTLYTAPTAAACTPPGVLQHQQRHRSISSPVAHRHITAIHSPANTTSHLQERRSSSASSGNNKLVQPAPSLRTGPAGPSPFAAEQLLMLRRPSPSTGASATNVVPSLQSHQQRLLPPPQVHLARPSGLYRNNAPSSTSMAASQLPGAAAAHSRLQLTQKLRLVRTSSATTPAAPTKTTRRVDGAYRRTPSASGTLQQHTSTTAGGTPSSPFKKRSSSTNGALRTVVSATADTTTSAAPQPHERIPSGTFTFYTTRGGEASRAATRTSAAAGADRNSVLSSNSSTVARKPACRAPRSNSAPTRRQAASGNAASTGAAAGRNDSAAVPKAIRFSPSSNATPHLNAVSGSGRSNTASAALLGSSHPTGNASTGTAAAAARNCTARTRAASATRTVLSSSSSAAVLSSGRVESGSPKVSRAPSASIVRPTAVAVAPREPSRLDDRNSSSRSRAGRAGSAVSGGLSRCTAGPTGSGGARPTISVRTHTLRTRPVVSTVTSSKAPVTAAGSPTRPSRTATRRVCPSTNTGTTWSALTRHDNNSSENTVSADQSSMIMMKESKQFLQEFQRMNQRELALFGTLLSTVANERQQQRSCSSPNTEQMMEKRVARRPDSDAKEKAAESASIIVQSAEEVSVWICKRPSLNNPTIQHPEGEATDVDYRGADSPLPAHVKDEQHVTSTEKEKVERDVDNDNNNTEVVVLVRRSRSHVSSSKTPSPSRCLDLGSHEKPIQHEQRSPSPTPNAPTLTQTLIQVVPRVDENMCPSNVTGVGADVHMNSRRRQTATLPSPLSPAPESPLARDGLKKGAGLQLRSVNDANENSISFTTNGGAVLSRKQRQHSKDAQRRSSTSLHTSRSCQRQRTGRDGATAPSDLHGNAPSEQHDQPQQRQRSVTSYTDIRGYSGSEDRVYRHKQENAASGGVGSVKAVVREYSPVCEESYYERLTEQTVENAPVPAPPPPLAALRRAKELAAEQAAALVQRHRERQQQQQLLIKENVECDGDVTTSYASPSMFSSCESPSNCSMGQTSSAVAATVSDVAEVRMSAAQLHLLIDSSRSRQNWKRYQQL